MTFDWASSTSLGNIIIPIGVLAFALLLKARWKRPENPSKLPLVNDRKWHELGYSKSSIRFSSGARDLITSGFEMGANAFYIWADMSFRLILSSKYADTLRNDQRLSLPKAMAESLHQGIPGFEPLGHQVNDTRKVRNMVRQVFQRSLGDFIDPLSSEADHALRAHWTDNSEWHEVMFKDSILKIITQVLSRVFLEDHKCRDPAWINLLVDFVPGSLSAARQLRFWPRSLRYVVSKFLPSCRKVRAQIENAASQLEPILSRREAARLAAKAKSEMSEQESSSLNWLLDAADDRYDLVALLLGLCIAAIDTPTDLFTHLFFYLAEDPKLVDDLRHEIIDVVGAEGFNKTSLQKLSLVDSVLKECQRMNPVAYVSMQRMAMEKIVLSDGLVIPKGQTVWVSACHMMDDSVWPEGEKFDGYRFLKLKETTENAALHNFVTTSTNHMGFGHGNQACPGRFFGAYAMKILLCHMVVKYDFKVAAAEDGHVAAHGHIIVASPDLRLSLRRRTGGLADLPSGGFAE